MILCHVVAADDFIAAETYVYNHIVSYDITKRLDWLYSGTNKTIA